jgi:hypothetical protein
MDEDYVKTEGAEFVEAQWSLPTVSLLLLFFLSFIAPPCHALPWPAHSTLSALGFFCFNLCFYEHCFTNTEDFSVGLEDMNLALRQHFPPLRHLIEWPISPSLFVFQWG